MTERTRILKVIAGNIWDTYDRGLYDDRSLAEAVAYAAEASHDLDIVHPGQEPGQWTRYANVQIAPEEIPTVVRYAEQIGRDVAAYPAKGAA